MPTFTRSTKVKLGAGLSGATALLALTVAPAFAATTITSPTGSITPVVDAYGNPIPDDVVISSSGWAPGQLVYAEVCDGVSSSSQSFNPTSDCDNATSPSAVAADANGNVKFDGTATNSSGVHNFAIDIFRGDSPSDLFNCLAPADNPNSSSVTVPNAPAPVGSNSKPALNNHVGLIDPGNPSWGSTTVGAGGGGTADCQIRLSLNNADTSAASTDVYLPIVLPQNGTEGPASATPESPLAIALPVGAVALFSAAGVILFRKRRTSTAA